MKVKILDKSTGKLVNALIRPATAAELPTLHEAWRFNFKKLSKASNTQSFVLVKEDTPDVIEGCLLFEMKNKLIAYMSYVELAPHNKGGNKRYDYVGGCLIAFAFKQSLIQPEGDYKGQLFFDVMELEKKNEVKLMALYSLKYGALKTGDTTMLIMDDRGEELITEYLERK